VPLTKSPINDEQQLLRVEEVADLLRTTPRTVYRWLNNGKLSGTKVGGAWRIPRQALSEISETLMATELTAPQPKTSIPFGQGDHFLALAPESEAIAGVSAKILEIALQHRYCVFAGCWSFTPAELRRLMRALGIPVEVLEAEKELTFSDFNAAFERDGAEGVLQEWRGVVEMAKRDNRPVLGIGAPRLNCWEGDFSRLAAFEAALDEIWYPTDAVSVCIYALADFVPERLQRLGTLISHHTGVLMWSERDLLVLRPGNFSQMFTSIN
jgi:excisionase family DNA binding protein